MGSPAKTLNDPFELGTLIAWLEKQPANKIYDYTSPCGCVLAQYFNDHGYKEAAVAPLNVEDWALPIPERVDHPFSKAFEYVSLGVQPGEDELEEMSTHWTFGQALNRALEERAKQDVR